MDTIPTTPTSAERLATLSASEPYWIAQAMQQQGSRFYRALGLALEAADLTNRHLIYQTWTEALWEFYQRGLRLAEQEQAEG